MNALLSVLLWSAVCGMAYWIVRNSGEAFFAITPFCCIVIAVAIVIHTTVDIFRAQ